MQASSRTALYLPVLKHDVVDPRLIRVRQLLSSWLVLGWLHLKAKYQAS